MTHKHINKAYRWTIDKNISIDQYIYILSNKVRLDLEYKLLNEYYNRCKSLGLCDKLIIIKTSIIMFDAYLDAGTFPPLNFTF